MTLFDLTLTQFASFLAGGLVVVAALYMLRLRRRTVLVSFALLWRRVIRDRPATSLLERLRRLLSFLLQVAFVTLLLLAIARPRVASDVERERRFVIVLDASAAMQATNDAGRTRLDEAKDLARRLVGRLGETDRAMIVRAGLTPEPVTAFEADRDTLVRAIDELRADDCRSDLDESVAFARRLIPGNASRIFVFTHQPTSDEAVVWCRVGAPRDNVAITRFAARPALESPGEYELLFEVRNFAMTDADVRLRIETAGENPVLVEERPMRLVPGGSVSEVVRSMVREDVRLRARLTAKDGAANRDGLALDDEAFTLVRAPRVIRVTVVGAENRFLASVLDSDPLIERHEAGEVVIFNRSAPRGHPVRSIHIGLDATSSPVRTSGVVRDAFVDKLAGDHPVMRFVGKLGDLNIAESRALVAEPGDVVLASCAGTPVMLARERDGRRMVVFGFDLARSDLVLRVAFPKIFRNALSWLVSGDTVPESATHVAGETIDIEGERFTPRRVGFVELGGRALAVNMSDPDVSNLRAQPPAKHLPELQLAGSRQSVGRELWPWLVAAAVLLTFFEWISYHRRWTV